MRTIKTYFKRAPFYNAFIRRKGCFFAVRLTARKLPSNLAVTLLVGYDATLDSHLPMARRRFTTPESGRTAEPVHQGAQMWTIFIPHGGKSQAHAMTGI